MKKNNNYKWVKHIIKEVSELEDGKTEVIQYVVIGRQDLCFDLFLVSRSEEHTSELQTLRGISIAVI